MCAASMLNDGHVDELLQHGANLTEVDGYSRTAFQIFLSRLYSSIKKPAPDKITSLYNKLFLQDISLQIDSKLVKVGANKIEFLFLNMLLVILHMTRSMEKHNIVFTNDTLLSRLECFNGSDIITEAKMKRTYVSSVLSRNEINSNYPYNRKLFRRIMQGKYILNPTMQIKANDTWVTLASFTNDMTGCKI